MTNLMPFDEINALENYLQQIFEKQGTISVINKDEIADLMFDLYIISYLNGTEQVNMELDVSVSPNPQKMQNTIFKKYNNTDFLQRVYEYIKSDNLQGLIRVIETDTHRIYNSAAFNAAKEVGAKFKTWNCLFINSRDTHEYLHETSVGIDEMFFTYLGDGALFPGEFGIAGEDCNCNCWLTYKM